jgi:tetratricopeptide (TPR) repeat protein
MTDTWRGYERADEELRRAILLDPDDATVVASWVENLFLYRAERLDESERRVVIRALAHLDQSRAAGPIKRARAAIAIAAKDPGAAEPLAKAALALDPEDADAELLLAASYLDGDVESTITHADAVMRRMPQLRRRERIVARAYANLGQYGSAMRLLKNRLKSDPDNTAVLRLLGDLELELGQTKAAITSYQRAVGGTGDRDGARLVLGDVLLDAGEAALAVESYQKVAESTSAPREDRHRALARWSRAELDRGELKTARMLAARALEENKKDPVALASLAESALLLGDLPVAEQTAQELVHDRSGQAAANVILGRIAVHRGAADQAVKLFEAAVASDPRDFSIRAAFAAMYLKFGGVTQAHHVLDAASSIDPFERVDPRSSLSVRLSRASVREANGIIQGALRDVEPRSRALVASSEALVSTRQGDLARARDAVAIALRSDRDEPLALLVDAELALLAQNPAHAEKPLKTLLRKGQDTALIHLLAARVEAKTGRPNEAKAEYLAAIQRNPDLVLARAELAALELGGNKGAEALGVIRGLLKTHPDLIELRRILAATER